MAANRFRLFAAGSRRWSAFASALALLGGFSGRTSAGPPAAVAPRTFAYVLQADALAGSRAEAVRRLAECGRDWIVLDAFFDGGADGAYTPEEIDLIRRGRAGRRVLAYLSIGEAETYRPYWRREWDANRDGRPDAAAPPWLCAENPDWEGNYKVRYWHAAWQDAALAMLDGIVRAGFDGAYLDIVDAFEFFEYDPAKSDWEDNRRNPETGRSYREDMILWVRRIADHARKQKPGFLIVPQNGAQLLENADYRNAIDAIGVEDLFTDGRRLQPKDHTERVLGFLNLLKPSGKPVLAIEYGRHRALRFAALRGAREQGFALLLTDRELKTLGECPLGDGANGDGEVSEDGKRRR